MCEMNTPVKSDHHDRRWGAGAAEVDITPGGSVFLYGYPFVARQSAGVADPLLASALWIDNGAGSACLFVSCDLIWLDHALARRVRLELSRSLGLPVEAIMLTATHTHSGPVTTRMLSNASDPVVPEPDPQFIDRLARGMLDAAQEARRRAAPASLSFGLADGSGLGGNRRDPSGPRIPEIPVLFAKDASSHRLIAIMSVCAMHPTVLHEDSRVISGDFPGQARAALKQHFSADTVYVHHMGASGNQSPRGVVRSNTLAEARRLGEHLADQIARIYPGAEPIGLREIASVSTHVTLPTRELPHAHDAAQRCAAAEARLQELRASGAGRVEVRTAECDWFGAVETLTLARAADSGQLQHVTESYNPVELQAIAVGDVTFVGWPGEVFVEFALQVMRDHPRTHVVTLANGELQGYLVTQQAVEDRAYEAGNAIFASPESGRRFVAQTLALLRRLHSRDVSLPGASAQGVQIGKGSGS